MATEEVPIFFFPIGRFTSFTNVLSATIFAYKANKTKALNTILKILNLTSDNYPECIEVTTKSRDSKKVKLFYLTRILAILILLEYENCDCNEDEEGEKIKLYSIFLKTIHKRPSIRDPINVLDVLLDSSDRTIGQLISLLSIMIEFSDYDNDSVLKFSYSFNYNFLRLISLDNSPDCYLYLRKSNNDEDSQADASKGIEIFDTHSLLNTDSKNKYLFIRKKLKKKKNDEIPYAYISYGSNTLYLSLISQDGENFISSMKCDTSSNIDDSKIMVDYEMNLPSSDSEDPLNFLDKDIHPFDKTIVSEDDEKKAEFSHFYYFTQKMDKLYDKIKAISDGVDQKDPINELYSIVYSISIFNYYIAKETKLEFEQENKEIEEISFITEFLTWENYLLLLIENIDQNLMETVPQNIISYIAKIYAIYNDILNNFKDNKYFKSSKSKNNDDDDDDDESNEEEEERNDDDNNIKEKKDDKNKNKIEAYEKIVGQLIKFTLILVLSISKELAKESDIKSDLNKIFVVIGQDKTPDGTKKDEWIEKFLGLSLKEDERDLAKRNLPTFVYERNIFTNDHKIGSMMRNFYMKSIDLIKREYQRFTDILNDVNKFGLKIRSKSDAIANKQKKGKKT